MATNTGPVKAKTKKWFKIHQLQPTNIDLLTILHEASLFPETSTMIFVVVKIVS